MHLLASGNGPHLKLTRMVNYPGVEVNTVKAWLCILKDSLQVLDLHPYCAEKGKRQVKTL
jgi:hypothetical protein